MLPGTVSQVSSSGRCGRHIRGCNCRLWAQLHSPCFGEGVAVVTFPFSATVYQCISARSARCLPLSGFLSSRPLSVSPSLLVSLTCLFISRSPSLSLCLHPSPSPLPGELSVCGQSVENSLGPCWAPGCRLQPQDSGPRRCSN